jgi:hypothetical protein
MLLSTAESAAYFGAAAIPEAASVEAEHRTAA